MDWRPCCYVDIDNESDDASTKVTTFNVKVVIGVRMMAMNVMIRMMIDKAVIG